MASNISKKALLEHPRVSLSPHIGAATIEAQENIGIELAEKIIAYYNSNGNGKN